VVPGMGSELEPRSKKSRKKCPPRVRSPPRFPHGTDVKTLVTLGLKKNVNLAHTYTLVGTCGLGLCVGVSGARTCRDVRFARILRCCVRCAACCALQELRARACGDDACSTLSGVSVFASTVVDVCCMVAHALANFSCDDREWHAYKVVCAMLAKLLQVVHMLLRNRKFLPNLTNFFPCTTFFSPNKIIVSYNFIRSDPTQVPSTM